MGGQSVGLQMFEKAHGFKTIIKKRKNIFFVAASQKETTIFDRRLSFLLFSSLFSHRFSLFTEIVVSR